MCLGFGGVAHVFRRGAAVSEWVAGAVYRLVYGVAGEGSMASGTSKKTELKLVGVARASLEELLLDFQDFLRQRALPLWGKEQPQAQEIRKLAYASDRSYGTYRTYVEQGSGEVAANVLICLIHQANYLLDRQLRGLEEQFLAEGGFSERLYQARRRRRATGPGGSAKE